MNKLHILTANKMSTNNHYKGDMIWPSGQMQCLSAYEFFPKQQMKFVVLCEGKEEWDANTIQ